MDDWKLTPARDHGLPLGKRLRSTRREGGLIDTCAQITARAFVRIYLKFYHRLEAEGRENLPGDRPFVLIANHASHLDAIVMASLLPWRIRKHMYPLAAGDVFFETPVIAAFAAGIINALPMWRQNMGRHALDDLRTRLLEDRCAYILFPEGRRSPDGTLLPFKPGLGMLVAATDVPVVPCYLRGPFEALSREALLPRPRKIHIRIGEPLRFDDIPNEREGWKHVSSTAEKAVRQLGDEHPARLQSANATHQ
jgi:1-acyl-sn-glycerol-3-phosphate acyltransferase